MAVQGDHPNSLPSAKNYWRTMKMPSLVVKCSHCGTDQRVEAVMFNAECRSCSNVLPPAIPPKNIPMPVPETVITTEKMNQEDEEKPFVSMKDKIPIPVVEAEAIATDDEASASDGEEPLIEGVDFGDLTLEEAD